MTIPFEIVGSLVAEMRARRSNGANGADLVRFLFSENINPTVATRYLKIAFCSDFSRINNMLGPFEQLIDSLVNSRLEPKIDAAKPIWTCAPSYPDLASRRDREVFRAIAKRRRAYLLVYAIDPSQDTSKRPTYRLRGVYSKDVLANVWRPGEGEAIRDELNMRLGAELVHHGPLDQWEHRNDVRADNPKLPVIGFEPDGNAWVYEDLKSLKDWYQSNQIAWPFTQEVS